jgi:hypothetical protein
MEDSLNYMNAVSEASQALNQVTALKEQATMLFEQKKETLGSEIELPAEISITGFGGFLGKKALGFVSEKIGEAVKPLGISEETIGKAISGDISGALEQGASEVQPMIESAIGDVVPEEVLSGIGILGRVSSGLENIGSIDLPSIAPELDIGGIYNQGLEDLKAQMGISDNEFNQYSNISLNDIKMPTFNDASDAGADVEMTDFSTIGSSEVSSSISAVGETVGASVGEAVGEVAGVEAAGAALDATGFLAPVGALVGLLGGIVGFFEGKKTEEETPPEVMAPVLNPSSQFI